MTGLFLSIRARITWITIASLHPFFPDKCNRPSEVQQQPQTPKLPERTASSAAAAAAVVCQSPLKQPRKNGLNIELAGARATMKGYPQARFNRANVRFHAYYLEGGWGYMIIIAAVLVSVLNQGLILSTSILASKAERRFKVIEPYLGVYTGGKPIFLIY